MEGAMKKQHAIFNNEKLLKFDIYDKAFEDLCDTVASSWARKAEQLRQSKLNKLRAR
jgi:hypothetical protein